MTSPLSNVSPGSQPLRSHLRSVSVCSVPAASSPGASSAPSSDCEVDPAVERLVALLRQVERAQDDLLALGGAFQTAFVEAQRAARVSPSVTQGAMRHFLQGQIQLAEARGSWGEGHKQVRKIAKVFGIAFPEKADLGYGDSSKYPPPPFTGAEDASPRVAA